MHMLLVYALIAIFAGLPAALLVFLAIEGIALLVLLWNIATSGDD